jgi:hypothetical protein
MTTPEKKPTTTNLPSSVVPSPIPGTVNVKNPGFEEQEPSGAPAGWNSTGAQDAIFIEDRGHSSDLRLTHKADEAYQVETWQTVSGITNGWYTLHVWTRSSGSQWPRPRHILLGCYLDSCAREWMGLNRSQLRECLGKSGFI